MTAEVEILTAIRQEYKRYYSFLSGQHSHWPSLTLYNLSYPGTVELERTSVNISFQSSRSTVLQIETVARRYHLDINEEGSLERLNEIITKHLPMPPEEVL